MCFVCGGSVDADDAAAALSLNDIGVEALAVGDVIYVHLLVLYQVGRLHQRLVNSDASDLVEVGFGNGNSMYFRL